LAVCLTVGILGLFTTVVVFTAGEPGAIATATGVFAPLAIGAGASVVLPSSSTTKTVSSPVSVPVATANPTFDSSETRHSAGVQDYSSKH